MFSGGIERGQWHENGLAMIDQYSKPFSSITLKIKCYIKDFFSKCDQIRRKLQTWSHLQKKSLLENFIFLCNDSHSSVKSLIYSEQKTSQVKFTSIICCIDDDFV